jgi:hypothetical protein
MVDTHDPLNVALARALSIDPEEAAELGARDAARVAAREPSAVVQEIVDTTAPVPFGQQEHDLLLRSIDHVATDWVNQLERVRQNSQRVEQLVLERAAKVKTDITQLYLLGAAALAEAKRGDDVNTKLASELNKLAETPP